MAGLTREQAVTATSEALISKLEGESCEPTGVLTLHREVNGITEWSASVRDDSDRLVTAFYYTTADDELAVKNGAEWDYINFTVSRFEIAD